MSGRLTDKQRRFAEEYLVDLNASVAYQRAGYSATGNAAESAASRLLRNVKVAEAIREAQEGRSKRVEVTQDWVLETLVKNVNRSMTAEPVYDNEGKETGEYTYQGSVANKALELVGKHLGMFKERHEHSGPDGGPIETRERSSVADEIRDIDRNVSELDAEIAALEAEARTTPAGGI